MGYNGVVQTQAGAAHGYQGLQDKIERTKKDIIEIEKAKKAEEKKLKADKKKKKLNSSKNSSTSKKTFKKTFKKTSKRS